MKPIYRQLALLTAEITVVIAIIGPVSPPTEPFGAVVWLVSTLLGAAILAAAILVAYTAIRGLLLGYDEGRLG